MIAYPPARQARGDPPTDEKGRPARGEPGGTRDHRSGGHNDQRDRIPSACLICRRCGNRVRIVHSPATGNQLVCGPGGINDIHPCSLAHPVAIVETDGITAVIRPIRDEAEVRRILRGRLDGLALGLPGVIDLLGRHDVVVLEQAAGFAE